MDPDDSLGNFLIPQTACSDCGTFIEGSACHRCNPDAAPATPAHNDTWQELNAIDIPDIGSQKP